MVFFSLPGPPFSCVVVNEHDDYLGGKNVPLKKSGPEKNPEQRDYLRITNHFHGSMACCTSSPCRFVQVTIGGYPLKFLLTEDLLMDAHLFFLYSWLYGNRYPYQVG